MRRGLALLLLAAGLGCRSTPPQPTFVGLPVDVETHYFAGTSFSGPVLPEDGERDLQDALAVTVSLYALESPPGGEFDPLGPHARLIISSAGENPFLPAPKLLAGVRCASVPDAVAERERIEHGELGRAALIASQIALLPPGITGVVRVNGWGAAATTLRRRIGLEMHRPKEASAPVELALTSVQVDPGSAKSDVPETVRVTEVVGLDLTVGTDGSSAVFLLPPPQDGFEATAMAAVVSIAGQPADDASRLAWQRELLHCQSDIERNAAALREPEPARPPPVDWPAAESVVEGLAAPSHQRTSLVFLASATDALLTRDLAIIGDDEMVHELAGAALKNPDLAGGRLRGAELAWALESCSFDLLLGRMATAPLPPELEASLVRRAGQVGRESDALVGVLKLSHSMADLDQQLVRANLIMLEERSPSARVRAYDWLIARGKAPEGFDPLAPSRQRRASLAKQPSNEPAPEPQGPQP